MEPAAFASIIPQLSIGVVAVLAFAVSVRFFIRHLDACNEANAAERAEAAAAAERERINNATERTRFLEQIEEHHTAMRALEREMRGTLVTHLSNSSDQIKENTHLMTRIVDYLDSDTLRRVRIKSRA